MATDTAFDASLINQVRTLRQAGRSPKEIARALSVPPAAIGPMVRELAQRAAQAEAVPPVIGCWVSDGWSAGLSIEADRNWPDRPREGDESGVACVAVARRHRPHRVAVCGYLVDTCCLGLKNTLGPEVMDQRDLPGFLDLFFNAIQGDRAPVEVPLEMARHLVWGAVDYARGLGFEPHPDFAATAGHLGLWQETSAITFGSNGVPLYVQGPYDDAAEVMRTLRRSVGEGNFHYSVEVPDSVHQCRRHAAHGLVEDLR